MSITVGVNSYVTLEEAELIIADMFNADEWTALTDPQKEKALKTAVSKALIMAYDSTTGKWYPSY